MWDEKWEISNNQYKWYGMKWKCGVISHMAKRQTKSKTMWYRREGTRNGSHEVLLHCPGRNQAITDTCPVAPHWETQTQTDQGVDIKHVPIQTLENKCSINVIFTQFDRLHKLRIFKWHFSHIHYLHSSSSFSLVSGLLKSLSFSCLSSSSIAEPWGPKTALYWSSTSFNVSETSDSRLLQRQERPLFRLSVSEKWKTNPNYHDIPTCFVIFVITHQN